MGVDPLFLDIPLLEFHLCEGRLQGEFITGGNFLANQAQGISIGDGGVVVVFVDVVAKESAGVVILPQERCAGETDLDGVLVGLAEVGKKAARRVVAAVNLVKKIDSLDGDIVIFGTNHIGIVLELLDIDHGYLPPAGVVVQRIGCFDIVSKILSSADGVHRQTATGKLPLRLYEQVETINNKVELGDDAAALEIVGQKVDVVIGQRGFSTALGMPDNPFANTGIQLLFNRPGGKDLRLTHHMLVLAIGFVHKGQCILQEK